MENLSVRSPDGSVTNLEAAKLLLDAWKFRQTHAWNSLTRYFLAAAVISVAPYGIKPSMVEKLSIPLMALPIVGGLLAAASIWLYAAEYVRAQPMSREFRAILEAHGYYEIEDEKHYKKWLFRFPIGWSTVCLLALATLLLMIFNVWCVWIHIN